MAGTMPGMASSRKRTAQPFSKGQGARTPSEPLSAALAGKPANAPNPMDSKRALMKGWAAPAQAVGRLQSATKLADILNDGVGGSASMPSGDRRIPPLITGPVSAKTGAPGPGNARRGLAADIEKPANQSASKSGTTKKKPKRPPVEKTYVSKGEINQTGNVRDGQDYATFTVKGKPGEYHEYVDPKTKKKSVKYVKP